MPPELQAFGYDDYELSRNAYGHLILTRRDGSSCRVLPVRSFPINAPDNDIALVDSQGSEQAWIAQLNVLPEVKRSLINKTLAQREFMPQVLRIRRASTWVTPSLWAVDTDKGPTELTLKSEEDIRRLSATALLITDAHGVQFMIDDVARLDSTSRRILDHFL